MPSKPMDSYASACARNHAFLLAPCPCSACVRFLPAKNMATSPKRANALDHSPLPVTPSPSQQRQRAHSPSCGTNRAEVNRRYRDKKLKSLCRIPGCTRGQHSHGMCAAHDQQRRRGTLEGK